MRYNLSTPRQYTLLEAQGKDLVFPRVFGQIPSSQAVGHATTCSSHEPYRNTVGTRQVRGTRAASTNQSTHFIFHPAPARASQERGRSAVSGYEGVCSISISAHVQSKAEEGTGSHGRPKRRKREGEHNKSADPSYEQLRDRLLRTTRNRLKAPTIVKDTPTTPNMKLAPAVCPLMARL